MYLVGRIHHKINQALCTELRLQDCLGEIYQPICNLDAFVVLLQCIIMRLFVLWMVWDKAIKVGCLKLCARAFSAMARPIRPLPSSSGWMQTKYKCVIPARVKARSGLLPSGAVS